MLAALGSLLEDTAVGFDGFPMRFYKEFWDVLGKEVLAIFAEYYEKVSWCRSLNSTFISLIQKEDGVVKIRDFFLISLGSL